jgi:hypothetical protein
LSQIPKPWLRKSTGTWHVPIDGKQVYLGKTKADAWKKYNRLMAHATGKASNVAHGLLVRYNHRRGNKNGQIRWIIDTL